MVKASKLSDQLILGMASNKNLQNTYKRRQNNAKKVENNYHCFK